MVEFTIKDIVQKLLGNIEPIGDTYYDDICYQNLKEVGELYYWLTEQMVLVATHNRKDLYSVSRNAELAGRYCDYASDLLSSVKGEDHHTVYAKWSYVNKKGVRVPCHCTNCGCRAHTETGNFGCQTITEDILSNFCPNCGARMLKDGDTE